MPVSATRQGKAIRGRRGDLVTLEQRFHLTGTTAQRVSEVLLTSPLVGDDSIFGRRPGTERKAGDRERRLEGFSPAPTFRFDVHLRLVEPDVFVVRFSQPERSSPYLAGDAVWKVSDEGSGTLFQELINTEDAMRHADQPLDGDGASLRRWLFFRVGHEQVMSGALEGIARLA